MWTAKVGSRFRRCGTRLTLGLAALAAGLSLRPGPTATAGAPPPRWTRQHSGVTARLRGVSAVSEWVAWASGAGGTVLRTVDGGRTWEVRTIPGAQSLDFRDVDAADARVAYVLSIGPGEASRIYRTADGGATWDLQFVNREPEAFFDAMSFWDADRGLAMSDSVEGRFVVVRTVDGRREWKPVPARGLPPALPGEGAFAASGTSVTTYGTRHAWIGTGAAGAARVLRSRDAGETWAVTTTPLPSGPSTGIFSVAFRDAEHGMVVGGDHRNEGQAISNAAVTRDGGATWTAVPPPGLSGFRSAVAYVEAAGARRILAVGPRGADDSVDDGRSWRALPCEGFDAISFAPGAGSGWAVGEGGRIALVRIDPDVAPPREDRRDTPRDARLPSVFLRGLPTAGGK